MPKYVIERELPGAGRLTGDELQAISQKSVEVLDGMAGRAQWLESFVTDEKLFCVYIADDEAAVREQRLVADADKQLFQLVRVGHRPAQVIIRRTGDVCNKVADQTAGARFRRDQGQIFGPQQVPDAPLKWYSGHVRIIIKIADWELGGIGS